MRDGQIIPGETSARLTVRQAGTYSVIIKNGECVGSAMNTATVTTESAGGMRYPTVDAKPDETVQLMAREVGVSYQWTPATGLDNAASASPHARTNTNTEYTVRITTDKGCVLVDTVLVQVTVPGAESEIFVPKAFTPDGNGVNDVLRPLGNIGTLDYFRVYNRWGQLVYQGTQIGVGWDGRFKGTAQPSDTYTWLLLGKTPDGRQLKLSGKTFLIR
jgi:gliding motility-associated-like protein